MRQRELHAVFSSVKASSPIIVLQRSINKFETTHKSLHYLQFGVELILQKHLFQFNIVV